MIRSSHARTWPLAFALATGTLAGCIGPDPLAKVGDGIRHDDFIYRVISLSTRDRIGTLHPAGVYRLIGFAVENHAGRVNHLWDNRIGYLVTDDGRSFENDEAAQQALDRVASFGWKARYVTPAEQRDETTLVFDVPIDAGPLYLKVRGELLMGDVFTFNRYQRTRVRVD
jgi:hypothetical protein